MRGCDILILSQGLQLSTEGFGVSAMRSRSNCSPTHGWDSVGVLDASALGYPELDVSSALEANPKLQSKLLPILIAIQSEWPHVRMPKQFQAMHGDMAGFFEIRMQDGQENFRVFLKPVQLKEEFLLLLASGTNSRRTGFPSSFYSTVRELEGQFAASQNPLSLFEDIT